MKIRIKPNKKIFIGYLAINAAGYNYENNPQGMHEVRSFFKKKSRDVKNNQFNQLVQIIKGINLKTDGYPRIVNLLSIFKSDESPTLKTEIIELIEYLSKDEEMNLLFEEYCQKIGEQNILDYDEKTIENELSKVLKLFSLPRNFFQEIFCHLNLLESYQRGTNYFIDNHYTISSSLCFDGTLNRRTIRHEFMHLIFKKITGSESDYSEEFEESFVTVANLFFVEENKRSNNIKFYFDNGYFKPQEVYNLINKNFIRNKKVLTKDLINEIFVQSNRTRDN